MCCIEVLLRYPRHFVFKRSKVISERLGYQSRSIRKKENAFFNPCFPQTPNDLECGIGFTRTRCHYKQNSILPIRNRFNRFVDCVYLVISGLFIGVIRIIRLVNYLFLRGIHVVFLLIHLPKRFRGRKFVERDIYFYVAFGNVFIMEYKSIAIRAKNKGNVQHFRIAKCLLHTIRHRVVIVFCFNHGYRFVGFIEKNVIRF